MLQTTIQRSKVITPKELRAIQHPLPEGWLSVAGILKRKKIDPLRYQKIIRKEWEIRLKKLTK
ncbi:MAG: hypothetical protein Q8L47_05445 [bacterium]|nr:hypothetical protein [bacterium]